MWKVLMVLSAISAVITLVLLGFGHPLLAMGGVVITLTFGALESLVRTSKGDSHERTK